MCLVTASQAVEGVQHGTRACVTRKLAVPRGGSFQVRLRGSLRMQHQTEVQATVNAKGVSAGLVDHVRDGNQLLAQGNGRILLGIATAADGDGTLGMGGVPSTPGRSSGYTIPILLGRIPGDQGEQAENRHCAVWPSGRYAWRDWR